MNIKGSRKWWLSIGATLGMLILLWAIGAAMAQGPGSEGGVQPQGDASIAATVNSRISYQGVLEESGQPVTDGLFSVELDVTHGVFSGQGLWLEVEGAAPPSAARKSCPCPTL